MVNIEEINMEDSEISTVEECPSPSTSSSALVASASEERILDAAAIEEVASKMERLSARAHLEALAKKLRSEAAALKRVEQSHAKSESKSESTPMEVETDPAPSAVPAPSKPVVAAKPEGPPPLSSSVKYLPIDRFSFDAGGYNSPTVTIYVSLPNVGSAVPRDNIQCNFTSTSFDLTVNGLEGKNYRLLKDNLEKDINPDTSKYIVKRDKIIIKLGKVKAEYGSYESWMNLTAKKGKKKNAPSKSADPSASIMELMKDMYDEGDDNMKKMIGETMMKQRNGTLGNDKDPSKFGGLDDMDMPMP